MSQPIEERLRDLVRDPEHAAEHFTMLEFGACDGYHTSMFYDLIRSSGRPFTYHAFEPEPANFIVCRHRMARALDEIALWQQAIGAEVGEAPFYVSGGQKKVGGRVVDSYYGSSSIRVPKLVTQAWPDMTFSQSTASVTTLDAFAAEFLHPGRPIDFIWADIQGAAGDMIRGGPRTLERVRFLYTEYDGSELYEGEVVGVEALSVLLPDFELVEDYGGDALFSNKQL